jgi:hypothetical protein
MKDNMKLKKVGVADLRRLSICKSMIKYALIPPFILTLTGCVFFNVDVLDGKGVNVVMIPSNELSYESMEVSQRKSITTVAGVVRLDIGRGHGKVLGHMDVVIKSNTGDAILIASAPYRRAYPTKHTNLARFEVSFYTLLPDHSEVTVKHHDGPMNVHLPLF